MGARLELRLLGGFRAELDGRPVPSDVWRQGRAAALVKLLALTSRKRLSREEVIEALWPGVSPDAGGTNVRKAVHFARRALGSEGAIGVRAGSIQLWPDGEVETDVERFEAASAIALSTRDADAYRRAAELYAGDLLPDDRPEPWLDDHRSALRERFLRVLRCAGIWDRILEIDPADEEAHRELIRAHLDGGNRQAAIRQFERLREALRDELGVGPDPESVALYERVLAHEGAEAPTAAERARALLAWGLIHWKRNDLREAERAALEARALAVDAGLGAQVGEASSLLASIGVARGEWRTFLRDELLNTVRRTPDVAPFVFDSNLCFTEFCLYLPDGVTEMARFAAELGEAAESAGSARAAGHAELVRGETELLSGQLEQAETTLRRAANLHRGTKTNSGESISLERLAEVSTARGQRWKARRALQSALRLAEGDPLGSHLLVKIRGAMVEAAADPQEAAAVAAEGEDVLAGSDVCQQCSMSFRMAAATAYVAVGDLPSASRHLDEATQVSTMWQGGPWVSAGDALRAAIEAAAAGRAGGPPAP